MSKYLTSALGCCHSHLTLPHRPSEEPGRLLLLTTSMFVRFLTFLYWVLWVLSLWYFSHFVVTFFSYCVVTFSSSSTHALSHSLYSSNLMKPLGETLFCILSYPSFFVFWKCLSYSLLECLTTWRAHLDAAILILLYCVGPLRNLDAFFN